MNFYGKLMYGFIDNVIIFIMKYYAGMNTKESPGKNTGPYDY